MFISLFKYISSILATAVKNFKNSYSYRSRKDDLSTKCSEYGIKTKTKEKNKHRNTVTKHVKQLKGVFKHHQSQFVRSIDIKDKWVASESRKNELTFTSNTALSTKWQKQYNNNFKKKLQLIQKNHRRITRMTFTAHKRLMSQRDIQEMRIAVKYIAKV